MKAQQSTKPTPPPWMHDRPHRDFLDLLAIRADNGSLTSPVDLAVGFYHALPDVDMPPYILISLSTGREDELIAHASEILAKNKDKF